MGLYRRSNESNIKSVTFMILIYFYFYGLAALAFVK